MGRFLNTRITVALEGEDQIALKAKRSGFEVAQNAKKDMSWEKSKCHPSHLPEDTNKLLLVHHLIFVEATVETMLRSKFSLSQRKATYDLYSMNVWASEAKAWEHL